ncbi:AmmeMemoRadiSam system protein A [bacterium]|nr:AmmeMemoRadiSam system protein A [bacterium]MBU1995053.1 AmmeMemoRadiSam system protein A [bacterium]
MLDSILLRIAKSAILRKFDSSLNINKEKLLLDYPYLSAKGAAFVTLNYKHRLRGCIGSITAHRPLLDDIIHNAVSAAFNDPRFRPLERDELSHLSLEVSVLSEPKILDYDDFNDLLNKVQPNIDGLILRHGPYHGTFLPQVWEQLPQTQDFLEHLSYKAGSNPSLYKEHPKIYRYGVDAIEGDFNAIQVL